MKAVKLHCIHGNDQEKLEIKLNLNKILHAIWFEQMTFVCSYCACYQTKITYKTQISNNTHVQARDHLYKKNISFFFGIFDSRLKVQIQNLFNSQRK